MSGRRWLARLAFVLMIGAVAILIGFAGPRSIVLLVTGAIGACAMLAGAYWFLAHRGVARWAGFCLAVLAPVLVIVLYVRRDLLWVAVLAVATLLAAVVTAKVALAAPRAETPAPEQPAARPRHPFLIMNPRSGGGKVERFGLKAKAEELGAEVALLEGPGTVDVAALARKAVADGADLLGVAGGDGTQALVAGIAAQHDLPFLCISAGTRNHFAMDLGLDRDDPSTCLGALTDGIEHRIDLGRIGDRIFVNNASFGAYAEIVRSPAYRDDKRGTTLEMLPDLLGADTGHRLVARVGSAEIDGPQAVLISNNPYGTGDIAGLGRRARLDSGLLGVIAVTVASAAQAIGLIRRGHGGGLTALSGTEVTVEATRPEIPVGIDGETIMMPTPVRCAVLPRALRIVLPRNRPGNPPVRPPFTWHGLVRLAAFGGRPPGSAAR